MCGINGAIAPHADADWRHDLAWKLLLHTQIRGKDATGIGWHDPDRGPRVAKAALPAEKFINDAAFEPFEEALPSTWIGHCRATTRGSENNNYNNHPIVSKQTGMILVHNGTIRDEDWRAKNDEGTNPYILHDFDGEVDTEGILRLIETMLYIPRLEDGSIDPEVVAGTPKDQWRRNVDMMKAIDDATYNIVGGFACCVLTPEEPDTVYLFRHNNPIYVAYIPRNNSVVWASTQDILKKSLTSYSEDLIYGYFPKKESVVEEYHGIDMPNNTLVRISAVGDGFDITHQDIAPPEYKRVGRDIKVTGRVGQETTATVIGK